MSNSVWQVILGLSRYSVFEPQNTPNTRKRILAPAMPCFRVFGVFRGSLLFGDKIEDAIAQQICLLVTEDDFAKAAGRKR
jgi:hypothetical protein